MVYSKVKRVVSVVAVLTSVLAFSTSPVSAYTDNVFSDDDTVAPYTQIWTNFAGANQYLQPGYSDGTTPVFTAVVKPNHASSPTVKNVTNWRVIKVGSKNSTVMFKNSASGKCLSAQPFTSGQGYPPKMVVCNSLDALQVFNIKKVTVSGSPMLLIDRYHNGTQNCFRSLYILNRSNVTALAPCGSISTAYWNYSNLGL